MRVGELRWWAALAVVALGCGPDVVANAEDPTTDESTTDAASPGTGDGTSTGAADTTGLPTADPDSTGTPVDPPLPDLPDYPPSPYCGDGAVDGYEECDDGNDVDDDACTNDCVDGAARLWQQEYIIDAPMCPQGLAIGPNERIGMAGGTIGFGDDPGDAWYGFFDTNGVLQWYIHWDGGAGTLDRAVAIGYDGVGDVFLAISESDGTYEARLRKTDLAGTEYWTAALPHDPRGANLASDLTILPDDSVVFMARTFGSDGEGLRLQRYATDGTPQWGDSLVLLDHIDTDVRPSLGHDHDGGTYLVAARRFGLGDDAMREAFVERLAPDGSPSWSALSVPPLSSESDHVLLGATTAAGTTSMALFDQFAPSSVVVRAWDSTGLGPQTADPGVVLPGLEIRDATHDGVGNLVIVGSDDREGRAWTIKLDPVGQLQWVRRTSDDRWDMTATAVTIAGNDDIIVGGCRNDTIPWLLRYAP
ncbi:MAG: DUF4215 domain-containing protein [Myxococcota bacterium]